jgi:hypothetical protein
MMEEQTSMALTILNYPGYQTDALSWWRSSSDCFDHDNLALKWTID